MLGVEWCVKIRTNPPSLGWLRHELNSKKASISSMCRGIDPFRLFVVYRLLKALRFGLQSTHATLSNIRAVSNYVVDALYVGLIQCSKKRLTFVKHSCFVSDIFPSTAFSDEVSVFDSLRTPESSELLIQLVLWVHQNCGYMPIDKGLWRKHWLWLMACSKHVITWKYRANYISLLVCKLLLVFCTCRWLLTLVRCDFRVFVSHKFPLRGYWDRRAL